MVTNAFGLRPIRTLSGNSTFTTRRYQKDTGANTASNMYVGDPVRLLGTGKVVRLLPADVTALAASGITLGVVAGFSTTEQGSRPPGVYGEQPSTYSATSQEHWVDVYVDPGIVYEVVSDSSAGATDIGDAFTVTAGQPVTAVGISGYMVKAPASATTGVDMPFKVIGISPRNLGSDGLRGDTDGLVEVILNSSVTKDTKKI